jgi:hypothetical protein
MKDRGCAFKNNLKIKYIMFFSILKLGQRQADVDLAL